MTVVISCAVRALNRWIRLWRPGRSTDASEGENMTTPEENGLLAGTFWQVDTPDRRVPGHLKVTGQPVLDVLGRLFDERANRVQVSPTGGVTITYSGDPDDLVADFEPRTIHGELEDGTRVSIVGAQGGKKRSTGLFDMEYRQEFRTIRHVILDEHVDDRQVYASCCFSVVGPHWWRSEDGEASTSDGGRLVVTREGDTRWSEFIPLHPLTVRDFDRWVLSPIATLASLLTANRAEAVHLHVRLTDASPWRKVYRKKSRHHLRVTSSWMQAISVPTDAPGGSISGNEATR